MDISRRKFLKTAPGVAAVGGAFFVKSDRFQPYRVQATIGTAPTDVRLTAEQPRIDEAGALWATVATPDELDELDGASVSDRVAARFEETGDGSFWVLACAVLPPEIELSLGRREFGDDVLDYDVTAYEDRIGGDRGDLQLESTDELLYHYKFQQWVPNYPWADPPDAIRVHWTVDPYRQATA